MEALASVGMMTESWRDAWILRFGVGIKELDGCVLINPQALVVVRFLGKLSVLLGRALGLGACLLSVTGVGLFAQATSGGLGAVRARSLGSSQSLW